MASSAASAVKVRYYKGEPTLISAQPGSVVQIVAPKLTRQKRVAMGLVAFNRTGRPYTLGYENVTIRTTSGAPVKMLSYEALEQKARNKANWTLFFAAVAAGANSYAAQQSAYGNYYGSAYTRTPYGGVSSTYSARYYSPVAAQIGQARANSENRQLFESISARLDEKLAQLDGTVLRTTTVDPGQAFGGAVVFDLPKGAAARDLVILVSFAGEVHEIALGADLSALEQASSQDLDGPAAPMPAPPAQDMSAPETALPPAPETRIATQVIARRTTANVSPAAVVPPAKTCQRYIVKVVTDPSKNICAQ